MICLIPAKSHSSRLPGKNLERRLGGANGKTLLEIAVERAYAAKVFQLVVISTDAPRTVSLQLENWPDVVLIHRPCSLCQPDSPDQGWIEHAVNWMRSVPVLSQELDLEDGEAMILRTTSPFFRPDLIDKVVVEFHRHVPVPDSLRTVRPVIEHPGKTWQLRLDGTIRPFTWSMGYAEPYNQPTQTLPTYYIQTGAVEMFKLSLLKRGTHSGGRIVPFIVDDPEANLDINTPHDWAEAERIWEHRGGKVL